MCHPRIIRFALSPALAASLILVPPPPRTAVAGGGRVRYGSTGRRAGGPTPSREPPPLPPLLTFAQLREQVLTVLEDLTVLRAALHIPGGPTLNIPPRDQDRRIWPLLVAGIRSAKPGLPAPGRPSVAFTFVCEGHGGRSTVHRLGFKAGMLGLEERQRGGMLPTLQVGPEFHQALQLLQQRAGIQFTEAASPLFHLPPPPGLSQSAIDQLAETAPIPRDRALAIAKRFAAAFGLPLTSNPQIEFGFPFGDKPPAQPGVADRPDSAGWWIVRNPDFAHVIIDAESGWVTYAENQSGSLENAWTPSPANLTRDQAIARPREAAAMMGLADAPLSAPDARLYRHSDGLGAHWYISWQRLADGIPFQSDRPGVSLDAQTGVLLRAFGGFLLPPPQPITVTVESAAAAARALELGRDLFDSDSIAVSSDPVLQIVHPDYFFNPESRPASFPDIPPRAAWTVLLELGEEHAEIWLDAADAKLLGGWATGALQTAWHRVRDAAGLRPPRQTSPQTPPRPRPFPFLAVASASVLLLIIIGVLLHGRRFDRRSHAAE